jgi:hypothetical protein
VIYDPMPADRYEGVNCVDDDGFRLLADFDGTSRAATWSPLPVQRYSDRRNKKPADFPWLGGHVLIMRRRAVDALADMLEAGGEILPLATNDGVDLYLLNVTRVIDALDEERSTLLRLPDSGKVILITAPAFHEPLVRGVDFFKLPRHANRIFVGERFVERVHAAGLVGVEFRLAWSPEGGPIKRRLW